MCTKLDNYVKIWYTSLLFSILLYYLVYDFIKPQHELWVLIKFGTGRTKNVPFETLNLIKFGTGSQIVWYYGSYSHKVWY